MNNKKSLKKLNLNKNLEMNEDFKKEITSAEGGRYNYFDYDFQTIEKIAKVDPTTDEFTYNNAATLVQALFPEYLICSGLFDCFVIFKIGNGYRVNPPKYCYSNLASYLNNNETKKYNLLIEEIIDLFKKNNIAYNKIWDELLNKVNNKSKEEN